MLHPIFFKRYTLLLIFFAVSRIALAQADSANMILPAVPAKDSLPENLFIDYENQAEFPGGDSAMRHFLAKNMRYSGGCMDVTGTVYVSFIVEKDGSLSEIKERRGIKGCSSCTREAMRVVALMPKWKPAKQNGKPIRSQYFLPIRFMLR